ncbi:MAG: sulfotransferase domain-containing protein, partial [Bacteroidota bacterium]
LKGQAIMINSYTPFVVFGASKSGTTWLQQILDSHNEVNCKFQRPVLPISTKRIKLFYPAIGVYNARRSPFKGLMDQQKEKLYLQELNYLNKIINDTVELITNSSGEEKKLYEKYCTKLIDAVLYEPGYKACGSKSYTDIDLFLQLVPDAKIITIVRDPRDVIVSKRFHTLRMGAYFLGDEKNKIIHYLNHSSIFRRYIKSKYHKFLPLVNENSFQVLDENNHLKICDEALKKYANEWTLVNDFILKTERNFPGKIYRVKYEDLKKDVYAEVEKLFNFLNVSCDQQIISDVIEKTKMEKKSKKGKESFFRKGSVGDWRNHLDTAQLKLINEIAGNTAKELNYAI